MTDFAKHVAIMFRCTMGARRVLWHANVAVHELGGPVIRPEHLALGLMEPDVRASEHLASLPIASDELRREIVAMLAGSALPEANEVPMSHAATQVMDTARAEADRQGHARIRSGHLLLAILSAETPVAALLQRHGLTAESIHAGLAEHQPGIDDA